MSGSIVVSNLGPQGPQGPQGFQNINIRPDLLLKLQKAVCNISFEINGGEASGSGFYFYDQPEDLQKGYYITAAHCVMLISSGVKIKISKAYIENPITNKAIIVPTNKIYIDGIADIALIQTDIDFTNFSNYCLKINTTNVFAGDICYVIGNPGGIDEDSISIGCVRDPNYNELSSNQVVDSMFVCAPGIGGNSGGPIVNINCDVIGIYTFGRINHENFGGGANYTVIMQTFNELKKGADNKLKLFLGIKWYTPSLVELSKYYPQSLATFDTNGVVIYDINTTSESTSPFSGILSIGDLLLKCVILSVSPNITIEFGNKYSQRTPGVLVYYYAGINIDIYYKKVNDQNVYSTNLTLNKRYSDVPDIRDGFLQSAY
jgi:hypothetical protein